MEMFTPGPYIRIDTADEYRVVSPEHGTIAVVYGDEHNNNGAENATFLAGSWDLLQSLLECVEELTLRDGPCIENCDCLIDRARKIISQATGGD